MTDLQLGGVWVAVFLAGLGVVALLHRWGLPRTYARDLLHVGAGLWIVGWPWWKGPGVPVLLAGAVFLAVAALPLASSRIAALRRLQDSVSGEGELWAGLVAYGFSFAALTALAFFAKQMPPAACAAGALCLGDGLGGLVGRRVGRHRYALPWSKAKTWEGTAAVAVFSALGIALALGALSLPIRPVPVAVLALVSAAAEALAPRAWDNALLPAAVYGAALVTL